MRFGNYDLDVGKATKRLALTAASAVVGGAIGYGVASFNQPAPPSYHAALQSRDPRDDFYLPLNPGDDIVIDKLGVKVNGIYKKLHESYDTPTRREIEENRTVIDRFLEDLD